MDPTTEQSTDIAQDDWDAVTAEDSSAVSLSGSDEGQQHDQQQQAAEDVTPAANADTGASQAATDPAQQQQAGQATVDPFAGLPEEVRNALARIPQLEHELRSTTGRVGALQRELAQARTPAQVALEAPAGSKLAALREELPEVAEALQEAMQQRGGGVNADQLRAELNAEFQESLLESHRPTWAQELTSNEFQSWLLTQPPAFQNEVKNSHKAATVLHALAQFDKFADASAQRTQQLTQRNRRLASAVTPSGARGRGASKSEDDMTDDELWDHITR